MGGGVLCSTSAAAPAAAPVTCASCRSCTSSLTAPGGCSLLLASLISPSCPPTADAAEGCGGSGCGEEERGEASEGEEEESEAWESEAEEAADSHGEGDRGVKEAAGREEQMGSKSDMATMR